MPMTPSDPTFVGTSFASEFVRIRPMMPKGSATSRPASGPATPISSRVFLFGMGSLSEMNAPNVPSGGIEGMKNGSEAATPLRLATR